MSDLRAWLREGVQTSDGCSHPIASDIDAADALMSSAADEIDRLNRGLEDVRRERDAAFAMSKCECRADEGCQNIVQARDKALEDAAVLIEQHVVVHTLDGKELSLRRTGNDDALLYAAAIRALKEKP